MKTGKWTLGLHAGIEVFRLFGEPNAEWCGVPVNGGVYATKKHLQICKKLMIPRLLLFF